MTKIFTHANSCLLCDVTILTCYNSCLQHGVGSVPMSLALSKKHVLPFCAYTKCKDSNFIMY